jgi:hypothetical protein
MQALASRYTRSENADEPANPSQNEKPMRQLVTKPNRQVATANAPPSELGYSGIEATWPAIVMSDGVCELHSGRMSVSRNRSRRGGRRLPDVWLEPK